MAYTANVHAWWGNFEPVGGSSSPSAPSAPIVIQNTIPTSQYGQTIPVLYGKARVPGGYVWSPAIQTISETETTSTGSGPWEEFTTQTTTRSLLSARVRFGRPLVPDSEWKLRKLWASGKLMFDGSTGYKAKGLKFRFYDGLSTQPRDPLMVTLEGESDVSAHRGYIDLVIEDLNVAGLGGPPVFEAEVIQGSAGSYDTDLLAEISAGVVNFIMPDWDAGEVYVVTSSQSTLRRFSLNAMTEFYAVAVTAGNYSTSWRYSPALDRIIYLTAFAGLTWNARVMNPATGINLATSVDSFTSGSATLPPFACLLEFGSAALLVGASADSQAYVFRFTASTAEQTYLSAAGWEGYTQIRCIAPGKLRSGSADVWICADTALVKMVVTSAGQVQSITEIATFTDDLRYVVYDGGDVVVWTDAGEVKRVTASGTIKFTKTVPYQITDLSLGNSDTANPDLNRLTDEFFFEDTASFYWTDLKTGLTRSTAKTSGAAGLHYYDGETEWEVTTVGIELARTSFTVGDGTQRNLSDFLGDLVVYGGGFEASQVECENIDDIIDGAVIDVTRGVRDIAKSVCQPYSIAMFERAGKVIFKRAETDGSFAVDAVLSSTDFKDSGGQAIKARRLNPEEFIARYGINYRDPAEIYQARAQYGEIPSLPFPVATAENAIKADIPIIIDADTIKELATQKVNRLAVERHEFNFTLKAEFGDLEPEDIVQFTFAGRLVTARIAETALNPDYSIDIKCTEFLSSVSVSISGAVGRPIEPDPVGTPLSRYYHLDIPLLDEGDDLAGGGLVQYHVLSSGGQTNWDGATLFRKDDAGVYQPLLAQVENGLVGVALSALPDTDNPYVTEFTRTINVAFISGDTDLLVSKTYLEVMNGANRFAIGAPGRWEVCQVIDISTNADGSFEFSGMVRGRGSSEEFTGLHEAGDLVVWLAEDNVQHLDYAVTLLDDAFDYKPVGFGGSITDTIAVNRTITGEAEKIPKPSQLDAAIDGTDIDLSWVRSGRIGVVWDDDGAFTAPLGESLEQYVVRIKDGPGGTVVRTVTVDDAETYTYTSADQTTYSGGTFSAGDSFTFDVRQVSGTGVICPAREATITL